MEHVIRSHTGAITVRYAIGGAAQFRMTGFVLSDGFYRQAGLLEHGFELRLRALFRFGEDHLAPREGVDFRIAFYFDQGRTSRSGYFPSTFAMDPTDMVFGIHE